MDKPHWPDCAVNHGGTACDMGEDCGSPTYYCPGCSSEDGAVYHSPPLCARTAPKAPSTDPAPPYEGAPIRCVECNGTADHPAIPGCSGVLHPAASPAVVHKEK